MKQRAGSFFENIDKIDKLPARNRNIKNETGWKGKGTLRNYMHINLTSHLQTQITTTHPM